MDAISFIKFFSVFWCSGSIFALITCLIFWRLEFKDDIKLGIYPKEFVAVICLSCICSWMAVIAFITLIIYDIKNKLWEITR